MRTRRLALAAIAGLLPLFACSDDPKSSDGKANEDTEAEGDDSTEASDENDQRDQELADSAVLTLDDMPSGWEVSPEDENADEQQDELNQAFADCLDIDVSEIDSDNPSAESAFGNTDDEEITSDVEVADSAGEVKEYLDRFRHPDGQQCYRDVISDAFAKSMLAEGEDLELGDITFNEVSFEDLGDDSIAFRLTVPVSSQGFEVELFVDVVAVAEGRVGVTTTFQSLFTPFDPEEALRLTEIVLDRIPADV